MQSSAELYLVRLRAYFLLILLTVPRPRKTGRVLRNVSLSRLENLFFELEFSSICLDGEIGMILVFFDVLSTIIKLFSLLTLLSTTHIISSIFF